MVRKLEGFGDLSLAPPDPLRYQCFTTAINQIADSGLQPTGLIGYTDVWTILIQEEEETMKRSVMASQRFKDRFHRSLLNVEELWLPVCPDEYSTEQFISSFFNRIAKAQSLRFLAIRIQNGSNVKNVATDGFHYREHVHGATHIPPALMAQTFPKLDTLAVYSSDNWSSVIQLEDLKAFVRRQEDLISLVLCRIRVRGLDYEGREDGQKKLGIGIDVTMGSHYYIK